MEPERLRRPGCCCPRCRLGEACRRAPHLVRRAAGACQTVSRGMRRRLLRRGERGAWAAAPVGCKMLSCPCPRILPQQRPGRGSP
eukprot:1946946-Heterocapsa_arctica.AAC.1